MTEIEGLTATLMAELSQYTDEVAIEVKQACKDVSKEMTDDIKRDSPKKTGDYRKGWDLEEYDNEATVLYQDIAYSIYRVYPRSDSLIELYCNKTVSYTHLRAHETRHDLVCRLLLEKKK